MLLKLVRLIVVLAVAVLSVHNEVPAQEIPIPNSECVYRPSTRIEPSVSSKVEKDLTVTFHFSYRLRNGSGGVQNISRLKIEIPGGATNLHAPGEWKGSFFKYKPVGGWYEGSENRDMVVRPGQEVSGFQFESKGLPSVVSFWTQGENPNDEEAGIWCPEGTAGDPSAAVYADFFFDSVKGKTIGPTAPPKVFDPVKYTEYILDLKNQSVQLGWIKNAAVSDELGGKLSAISSQLSALTDNKIPLSKGNTVLELGAQFLQFVESNSCKDFDCPLATNPLPLTSEAYALLFYNMDYFLSQVRLACGIAPPPSTPSPSPKRPSPSPKRK